MQPQTDPRWMTVHAFVRTHAHIHTKIIKHHVSNGKSSNTIFSIFNTFLWLQGIFCFDLLCTFEGGFLSSAGCGWGQLRVSLHISPLLSCSLPPQLFIHYNILSCSQPIITPPFAWGRAWRNLGEKKELMNPWTLQEAATHSPTVDSIISCKVPDMGISNSTSTNCGW